MHVWHAEAKGLRTGEGLTYREIGERLSRPLSTVAQAINAENQRPSKRERDRHFREANRERLAEKERRRRAANREQIREKARRRHASDPEQGRARVRRNKEANPEAAKARSAVREAIRAGRLVPQPCEKQDHGCTGRIEAHHDDYSRGLDVQWLCALHHRRLHAQGRALAA